MSLDFKIVYRKKPATRRGILSVICSVYDPLGLTFPHVYFPPISLYEAKVDGYRTSNSLRHRVVSSLKTSQKSNEASFIISPSPLVKTTEEFLAFEKPMYIKITASL